MDKQTQEVMFSSKSKDWETPQDFYEKLNEEFGPFTLDPCATEESTKVPECYFTAEDDGLFQDWDGQTVFMNPPYGREISAWIGKAYSESLKPGTKVVCLIPARTDTKYWHEYCMEYAKEIHFVKGRLKFEGTSNNSAPFPSAVVVFDSTLKYVFSNYPMVYTMEK